MTLPTQGTVVTYPTGATSGAATVLHVHPLAPGEPGEYGEPIELAESTAAHKGDRFVVLLDTTPVHPLDAGWPDQPADRATLEWNNGGSATVSDCIVAATDGTHLLLGADIPVRKGTEGWTFVVAHIVTSAPPEGIVVTVEVDEKFRRSLSVGHTGCHLASLALNRSMGGRWSKDVGVDALGAPNFDAEAIDTSRILEFGSRDTYRLGKSLRKKGFVTDGLAEALPAIEVMLNAALTEWVDAKSPVSIDRDGDLLTDRRYWVCELPEGEARIACGGTHVKSLSELKGLTARLTLEDDAGTAVLVMETSTK